MRDLEAWISQTKELLNYSRKRTEKSKKQHHKANSCHKSWESKFRARVRVYFAGPANCHRHNRPLYSCLLGELTVAVKRRAVDFVLFGAVAFFDWPFLFQRLLTSLSFIDMWATLSTRFLESLFLCLLIFELFRISSIECFLNFEIF